MKRTFVRPEKGSYIVWEANDGSIQGATITATLFETTGGIRILGWWAERPTKEELDLTLDMMGLGSLPADPRQLLTDEERVALDEQLQRMAKQRRDAEVDGRGLGIG